MSAGPARRLKNAAICIGSATSSAIARITRSIARTISPNPADAAMKSRLSGRPSARAASDAEGALSSARRRGTATVIAIDSPAKKPEMMPSVVAMIAVRMTVPRPTSTVTSEP